MDDIWWFVLVLVALVVGLAVGFGAGRFGRVSLSRARWAEVDAELTGLRSDNASLRAEVDRLEGELVTARMFARSREAAAEPIEGAGDEPGDGDGDGGELGAGDEPGDGDGDGGDDLSTEGTSRIRR